MFTAIEERDGSFLFCLHRSPEAMDPATARAALRSIEPLVTRLRRRAAAEGVAPRVSRPGERPRPERRDRAAAARRRRAPATVGS